MKERIKLVQFGAPTCLPCVAIKEKLMEWVDKEKSDGINIEYEYISVDQEPKKAAEAGVFTVPALKLYIDDKVAVEDAGYFSLEGFVMKSARYLEMIKN